MRSVKNGLALFVFWCVVVPPRHLGEALVGLVAAATLALAAEPLFGLHRASFGERLRWRALPGFLVRTVRRVAVSAWQVLRIVLDPRMPLAPRTVQHDEPFDDEAQRVFFANLVTLTPGTLTVELDGDRFLVHCLDPALAHDVLDGSLAEDVRRLLGGAR
jgi:multicomponent Na+:H+ antiporter subunit E